LIRMRELAVQSATATLTDEQRVYVDLEYQALIEQIDKSIKTTNWNNQTLLDGFAPTKFGIQAGVSADQKIEIDIPPMYASVIAASFTNGDFESGALNSSAITGWTFGNTRVTLDGNTQIGGWPTPMDATKPAPSGGDAVPMTRGTFSSKLTSQVSPNGGALSAELSSTGVSVQGYGIAHGPYLISNDPIKIRAGESVSFDWSASGGLDAYDVYAYLLNVDDGSTVKLLDVSGNGTSMTAPWTTVSKQVTQSGRYKFVFVSGTFDATGGTAAGAKLFVDNVKANVEPTPTLQTTNVLTILNASDAISKIDLEIENVSMARSKLGAVTNRLMSAANNLSSSSLNFNASLSRILDTDYAAASAELARTQIIQKAGTKVLAESNLSAQMVLQLLKS